MGWWGYKPADNDTTSDAWIDVIKGANKVAEKMYRSRLRGVHEPSDLYAYIGLILMMADGGIPIDQENYDHAVDALDEIEKVGFLDEFRNPAAAKREFQSVKKRLLGLKRKAGPAVGLAGGRLGAIL